jgi:hypothetical protein
VEPAADLDALAGSLRERLLSEPVRDGPDDVEGRIRALVEREAALLDVGAREALVARVAERSFGLGPLEPLLRDPDVDEVMVNGVAPVWVERGGRLERTDVRFASAAELRDAIERILAPLGRRVDEAEPLCDARLPDQWQLYVVGAFTPARAACASGGGDLVGEWGPRRRRAVQRRVAWVAAVSGGRGRRLGVRPRGRRPSCAAVDERLAVPHTRCRLSGRAAGTAVPCAEVLRKVRRGHRFRRHRS